MPRKASDNPIIEHLFEPSTEAEETFRHSHWAARRANVRAALIETTATELSLDHYDNCGSGCCVEKNESDGRYRVRGNYCRSRHCEPCNRARAKLISANLKSRLELRPRGRYRFLTLTIRHNSPENGTDQVELRPLIDRLYKAFADLRRSKLWKQSQLGGCFICEIKRTQAGWHPHLHIISEGDYLPQSKLADEWHRVTGDSSVVDIRKITDETQAAIYVTKYVTKGTSPEVWNNPDLRQEYVIATKGLRTCATYGTWRNFKLTARPKDTDTWTYIAKLDTLIRDARAGNPAALKIILSLRPPGAHDATPDSLPRPPPKSAWMNESGLTANEQPQLLPAA